MYLACLKTKQLRRPVSAPIFAIGTPRIHRNASHSTVNFGSTTVRQQLNYGVEEIQSWTTLRPYIQEETKKNPKSQQLNENMAKIQIGSLKCFTRSHKRYNSAGSLDNIFGRSIISTVSVTTNAT